MSSSCSKSVKLIRASNCLAIGVGAVAAYKVQAGFRVEDRIKPVMLVGIVGKPTVSIHMG